MYRFFTNKKYAERSDNRTIINTEPQKESTVIQDSIDQQLFTQNLARFCGAIKTVRAANDWRSTFQHAGIHVELESNGTIHISASYEHDSNFNVLSSLSKGGYLDYIGFKYREDGFNYDIVIVSFV